MQASPNRVLPFTGNLRLPLETVWKGNPQRMNIRESVDRLSILSPLSAGDLTIFPLTSPRSHRAFYLTLASTLEGGAIQITEVSEQGEVPHLLVRNAGKMPVLLVDGEELIGAKQNRILNLSLLVPAEAELVVPVSCVEAGRWTWSTRDFQVSNRLMAASVRASKSASVSASLRSSRRAASDQHEVWRGVDSVNADLGVHSATASMSESFERRKLKVDEIVDALRLEGEANGCVVVCEGRVRALELFGSTEVFAAMYAKLLRSWALESLRGGRSAVASQPSEEDVRGFLREVAEAPVSEAEVVGLGGQFRVEGDGVSGAALIVGEDLLHLVAFARDMRRKREAGHIDGSWLRRRMARPGDRS